MYLRVRASLVIMAQQNPAGGRRVIRCANERCRLIVVASGCHTASSHHRHPPGGVTTDRCTSCSLVRFRHAFSECQALIRFDRCTGGPLTPF
jgi:hypothetical protein